MDFNQDEFKIYLKQDTLKSKTFGRIGFGKKLRTKTFERFFRNFGEKTFGRTRHHTKICVLKNL